MMGWVCGEVGRDLKKSPEVAGKTAEKKSLANRRCRWLKEIVRCGCGCGWAVAGGDVDTRVNSQGVWRQLRLLLIVAVCHVRCLCCYISSFTLRDWQYGTRRVARLHQLVNPVLLCVLPGLKSANSAFCPHCVFMCFVWISEQTAIISLYIINCLVFMAETECVYCAVRTESSTITGVKFRLLKNPCPSSGSWWPLAAESRVRS
jgi:hypothetical protein